MRQFVLVLICCAMIGRGQPSEKVEKLEPGVTAPKLISKKEPVYTEEGRRKGIEERVALEIVVGVDGKPEEIRVVSPLDPGLDKKAIEAVTKWRFKPREK